MKSIKQIRTQIMKQSKKTKTKKYVSKPSYSKTLTDLQSLKSKLIIKDSSGLLSGLTA